MSGLPLETRLQNRATLGIIYLCSGILIFSLQDAIIKAVSGEYPLTQVVATRCLVSAPILLVLVHFEAGIRALFSREFWPLVGRAFLMLLAYTTYYMAFPALPLADAPERGDPSPLAAASRVLVRISSGSSAMPGPSGLPPASVPPGSSRWIARARAPAPTTPRSCAAGASAGPEPGAPRCGVSLCNSPVVAAIRRASAGRG